VKMKCLRGALKSGLISGAAVAIGTSGSVAFVAGACVGRRSYKKPRGK
jgi:hypothetical protein